MEGRRAARLDVPHMAFDKLEVDLTVVLGSTQMPMHRLLRLGRGALIALEGGEDDIVDVLANGTPIARGRVMVEHNVISVEIVELTRKPEVTRTPGATIGDTLNMAGAAAFG